MTDSELINLRKKLYEEINKLHHCKEWGWAPEARDFETVKEVVLSHIAYKIWETQGKPKDNDIDIWVQAEETWNFIRYMW
jgi:hypothetical protein